MLRKISKMKELEDIMHEAINQNDITGVAVKLTIPGRNGATEVVLNRKCDIKSKLFYYKRNFNDDLVNNRLDSIKIVEAGYGTDDLWEE